MAPLRGRLLLLGLAPTIAAGLWPIPAASRNGSATVTVVPSRRFFRTSRPSQFLSQAFDRYAQLTFPHTLAADAAKFHDYRAITGVLFTVDTTDDDHPQIGTDESYSLVMPAEGGMVGVRSKTLYGALRALETFSQLVQFDFARGAYTITGAPWEIFDEPRFPHRGLMIDTGRHFLPLASIRGIVDSLPYAKLNVLHWHMVDSQSFPFQSRSSPRLWEGAYSPAERYTREDVESIVEYARLRGVRVMAEFDMPGHAKSWCAGYPEICPSPACQEPLNVASNATFELIEGLLGEVTGGRRSAPSAPSGLFPDDFVHLGGDEVNTDCWAATPAITAWLASRGLDLDGGYAYFVKRAAALAIRQGRRPVQWSEVFDHFKAQLPKETIVHVWKDVTNVTEVAALGYDVLRNVGYDGTSWYLDNLDVKWDSVYRNDPCKGIPTDQLCARVLGGHGEMWGETVDGSNLQQTVWPRLAAIAEKLWSPRNQTRDAERALPRISDFRCLLLARGIAAAPVANAVARSAPGGPSSCYSQPAQRVAIV